MTTQPALESYKMCIECLVPFTGEQMTCPAHTLAAAGESLGRGIS
jgi:hypothetical protein